MIYIDFDGVILDTEELLFEEWRKKPNHESLPGKEKIEYIQNADWNYIIKYAEVINDSLALLKEMDPTKTSILTKIHSRKNEGQAKLDWARENGIKQNMILVPHYQKKSERVQAKGNILIDDCLANLEDWENNDGIPYFFDMDNDGYDSWHQPHTQGYAKVLTLSKFK